MQRYNLLHEHWIRVITDEDGTTKEVSLIDVFENAHTYLGIRGDSRAQDFSVLRVLLAVLHTVFSRFDHEGEEYGFVTLNYRYKPLDEMHHDDLEDYTEAISETWKGLWNTGSFPIIIKDYLLKWEDRFYLYDDTYPFYQVTKSDVSSEKISKTKPSPFLGKNLNRLISESGNKTSLFSPKYEAHSNKEKLRDSETARWLITLQNYIGLSDKTIFGEEKYDNSKGWLFDIGGIVLKGSNLFETLMLNLVLEHSNEEFMITNQQPGWEVDPQNHIKKLLSTKRIDNIAELYTTWSRAIYLDPEHKPEDNLVLGVVKVPEVEHEDNFLEPMTLWRYNETGPSKSKFTPRKHRPEQSMWRNFGIITSAMEKTVSEKNRQPGVINWLSAVSPLVGNKKITIEAISMRDDGNATSWVPIDEIHDELNVYDVLLVDDDKDGWVYRINEAVELTKNAVDRVYRGFVRDIRDIRNIRKESGFVNLKIEDLYTEIDAPFKRWVSSIEPYQNKDEAIAEWKRTLKSLVSRNAEDMMSSANHRDFKGISSETGIKNIATAYNVFSNLLNKLVKGEASNG